MTAHNESQQVRTLTADEGQRELCQLRLDVLRLVAHGDARDAGQVNQSHGEHRRRVDREVDRPLADRAACAGLLVGRDDDFLHAEGRYRELAGC